ncbi:hypothetical protein NEHOM01_1408 [Nematocida homosporus]|uniref:uncharacterized protein n=1 Tax=Nematocida homosporus TaxID=1912981 RepID=UPI00222085B1|nr:uncharacterized protein NEHOM01_1408 [Nematocida homosporus]KAI5186344.1 hypothetical protein NEHOM01_1408 [Nematocida homosporus]
MLRLDALKVLATETRQTLQVEYCPDPAFQRAFLLPRKMSLLVEVFSLNDLPVFYRAEPLFSVDGYLHLKAGEPIVVPCPGLSFYEPSSLPKPTGLGPVSKSGLQTAVATAINGLVAAAARKAEKAHFKVDDPGCPRLCLFLLKLGRIKEAFACIRDSYSESFTLKPVLPYLIYEAYCSLFLPTETDATPERLLRLAQSLGPETDSETEDRILTCLLIGVKLTRPKKSPELLGLYSRIQVSPEKKALFFFLFAQNLGQEAAHTKYALIGLAETAFSCPRCVHSRQADVQKALRTIVTQSSTLNLAVPICEQPLTEYLHGQSPLPTHSILIESEIKDFTTTSPLPISHTQTIYSEGRIFLHSSPSIIITSLLIESPFQPTLFLKASSSTTSTTNSTLLAPVPGPSHLPSPTHTLTTFFLPYSTLITAIHLQHKGQKFKETVSIPIEIVPPIIPKKLYAHRYSIIPTIISPTSNEESTILSQIISHITPSPPSPPNSTHLNRTQPNSTQLNSTPPNSTPPNPTFPESYSKLSPMSLPVRIPYRSLHTSQLLYKELRLHWLPLPLLTLTEQPDTLQITAHNYDLLITYNLPTNTKPIQEHLIARHSFILKRPPSGRINWSLLTRNKSGFILL